MGMENSKKKSCLSLEIPFSADCATHFSAFRPFTIGVKQFRQTLLLLTESKLNLA